MHRQVGYAQVEEGLGAPIDLEAQPEGQVGARERPTEVQEVILAVWFLPCHQCQRRTRHR